MKNNNTGYRVLLLDDDEKHLLILKAHLNTALNNDPALFGTEKPTIDTETDAEKLEGRILSAKGSTFSYDVIIADVFMPLTCSKEPDARGGAVRIYDAIKKAELHNEVLLVVMSNRRSDAARELSRIEGEQRLLDLPWVITQYPKSTTTGVFKGEETLLQPSDWVHAVARAICKCKDYNWRRTFVKETLLNIRGASKSILEAKLLADKFADQRLILIMGPTGSGKELFAKAIHENSSRRGRGGTLQIVNVQSWAPGVVESEMFGHEKNSFTGAAANKRCGIFELSNHGTVVLDEFGSDIAVDKVIDEKLRRVFREPYTYRRVGGTQDMFFYGTVVLMGSKLKDFIALPDQADLFGRVSGKPTIVLPALSECPDDIVPLAEVFLTRACRDANKPEKRLSDAAKKALIAYRWPGNVAELENLMQNPLVRENPFSREISVSDLLKGIPMMLHNIDTASSTGVRASDFTSDSVRAALAKHEANRTRAALELFGLSLNTTGNERNNARKKLKYYIKKNNLKDLPLTRNGRPPK